MNPPHNNADYLIIMAHDAVHLLVHDAGRVLALPRLALAARHPADVAPVNRFIGQTWGLRCITRQQIALPETGQMLVVVECLTPDVKAPDGMRWLSLADMAKLMPEENHLLEYLPDANTATLPWSQPGWFQKSAAILTDIAERMDMLPSGPVMQLSSSNRACILAVSTTAGALYFKAVPEAFSYEPVITRVLSLRYPGRAPDVRAVNIEQSWMLMRGFEGQVLATQTDLQPWLAALRNFGEMQLDLSRNTAALIALGLADRHVDYIASQIEHLLYDLSPSLPPAIAEWLQNHARLLRNLCYDLLDYKLPLSLVHGDFRAGNISIEPNGEALFFDWADCAVSHPFFDLPYFLHDIEKAFPGIPDARQQLRDAYLEAWAQLEGPHELRDACALAEIIGPLHQAMFIQRHILPHTPDLLLIPRLNTLLQRSYDAFNAYQSP